MPASVTLLITKGDREGESFTYTEKESLIIGRDEDCSIVINEQTVSRYHCMVEILPPAANFRDFGSGNGIKLNGKTAVPGRFKTGQSSEEAKESEITEFALTDGDVIALSSKCEISVKVFVPEYCADCLAELAEGEEGLYMNDAGESLCPACFDALEAIKAAEREAEEKARLKQEAAEKERLRKENEEKARLKKEAAEKERLRKESEEENRQKLRDIRRAAVMEAKDGKQKCVVCKADLPADMVAGGANICPKCKENPLAVFEYMLRLAAEGNAEVGDIKGFRKISELGRGGMGAVFKVEEEATGKIFAMKVMLASNSMNAMARAKFIREAMIGKQLDHPNILIHYTYGNCGDAFYVLQELCEGGSVDKLIERRGGKLPVSLATDITLQILDSLIYAHKAPIEVDLPDGSVIYRNGIVHRDIKPANYFLMDNSSHPNVKLADFGLAKAYEASGMTGFTRTGDAGGTPVFMPRQQIINFKYALPDVDVWAVAASYYFMLTGHFPKDFSMKKEPWSQALKNPPVQIRKRDRDIDKKLADVIDHALEEKPSIGFSTAKEFKEAIEGAL